MKTEVKLKPRFDELIDNIETAKKSRNKAQQEDSPFFTHKMKAIINKINKETEEKFQKRIFDSKQKWILKSQLKPVCILPHNGAILLNPNISLEKIRNQCRIVQAKIDKKQAEVEKLFEQIRVSLDKKKVLDRQYLSERKQIKKFRIKNKGVENLCIVAQKLTLEEARQIQDLSTSTHTNKVLVQSVTKSDAHLKYLRILQESLFSSLKRLEKDKKECCSFYEEKLSQLREFSNRKLPYEQQIINNMFLIGILHEQICILRVEGFRREFGKKMSYAQRNGLTKYLLNREIVVEMVSQMCLPLFVMTVIYFHVKSLHLPDLTRIMNRVSYFSQQFKGIYEFSSYLNYTSALIERLKCQSISYAKVDEKIRAAQKKRLVLKCDKQYLPLLSWVLGSFPSKDNLYVIEIGQIKIVMSLATTKAFQEPQSTQTQYSLRLSFKNNRKE